MSEKCKATLQDSFTAKQTDIYDSSTSSNNDGGVTRRCPTYFSGIMFTFPLIDGPPHAAAAAALSVNSHWKNSNTEHRLVGKRKKMSFLRVCEEENNTSWANTIPGAEKQWVWEREGISHQWGRRSGVAS